MISLLSRPWPILVLSLFHILAPVVNVYFNAWRADLSAREFLEIELRQAQWGELFAMFGLFPLMGLVISACQRWSYYAYLILMGGVFYTNYSQWQANPHLFEPAYVLSFFALNTLVVGYFLLPAVKEIYFNERLRWWESEPRYLVGLQGEVVRDHGAQSCQLINISQGGARIKTLVDLKPSDPLVLRFNYVATYGEMNFVMNAVVTNGEDSIYGVRFEHSEDSQRALSAVIKREFAKKYAQRDEKRSRLESFLTWLRTLLQTGRGLLPESSTAIHQRRKKLKKTVKVSKMGKKTKKKYN